MSESRISRVAIVGAGGNRGGAIARELLRNGKHEVTAITRVNSPNILPDGVRVVVTDYNEEEWLISSLRGQQFLIITLSVTSPPDVHSKIIKAADAAGVSYIMPNLHGGDIQNKAYMDESLHGKIYSARLADMQGVSPDWVVLVCGFWYEFSLAMQAPSFGFDFANKTATFFDDGNTKIDVSTWQQCGRAVAALLSLPLEGPSPCLSDWRNKPLYINSFKLSQRDMLDSIHRVLGDTDADWAINHESSEARSHRGIMELEKGNKMGFAMASYGRMFFPNGDGDFESKWGTANVALGLPVDDVDEATRRALKMVESGWSPVKPNQGVIEQSINL